MAQDTLKFELCEANFLDSNINPNFEITFNPPEKWYANDKHLLYDHKSSGLLYTKKADDDTVTVSIIIDFKDDVEIDIIKLLGINFKDLIISRRRRGEAGYTVVKTYSNYASSAIHWESDDLGLIGDSLPLRLENYGRLLQENGEALLTETVTTGQFFKFEITLTQIENQEKRIGELYMGRRYMKLQTGKVLSYDENFSDPKGKLNRDYLGHSILNRVKSIFNSSMILRSLSTKEYKLIREIVNNGGIFNFFPSSGEFTEGDIPDFSINDVYLIEAKAKWVVNPWGEKARGAVKLELMETRISST